ncbi:MAG: formate dehydrogenase subunit gamma [Hyphomonadaceae bacterium]
MREKWDEAEARHAIAAYAGSEGPLLPMLHALQARFGCIPPEATPFLADALNLSRAEVHGVISFYHDFRTSPPGKVVVKVCRAEACQAMGGPAAADALLRRLGVNWGETSADGAVTIEPVYCLGLCAAAPAALIDGKPHARLNGPRLIDAVEAAK